MNQYWKSVAFCGLLFVTLQLIGLQYPSVEHAMVRARWLIWGLGMGWRYWKLPTFPRRSQNQTVSGGVEGAHEGTTADKSGSREPEKLNKAQECECGHEQGDHTADGCMVSDQFPDSGCECNKFNPLAESPLSSPPPSPTIPCVWCSGRGYIYVTGKRCEGCVGTGRLKDYSAQAGAEPDSLALPDSEKTKK